MELEISTLFVSQHPLCFCLFLLLTYEFKDYILWYLNITISIWDARFFFKKNLESQQTEHIEESVSKKKKKDHIKDQMPKFNSHILDIKYPTSEI